MIIHRSYVVAVVWTIIITTIHLHHVTAHNADARYHPTSTENQTNDNRDDERSNDHKQNHDRHHDHGHHISVESRQLRNQILANGFFNATTTTTTRTGSSHRCGADDPSPELVAESSRVMQKWMSSITSRQATTINVDTYFHIVTADNQTIGQITDTDVINQLQVLNDSYRPYGFIFTLLGTTRNNNNSWYYGNYDAQMKSTLRVGDAATLNVYFTAAQDYLGYARFPWNYLLNPTDDGVVVQSGTVPGGNVDRFNEGKTLVHEVGHWLGLLHTFQFNPNKDLFLYYFLHRFIGQSANCFYNDDGVRDTPRQVSETLGCPTGRDTCLLSFGVDPINNYMDYSDDKCYNEFTNGQMDRMKAMWNEYRAV